MCAPSRRNRPVHGPAWTGPVLPFFMSADPGPGGPRAMIGPVATTSREGIRASAAGRPLAVAEPRSAYPIRASHARDPTNSVARHRDP